MSSLRRCLAGTSAARRSRRRLRLAALAPLSRAATRPSVRVPGWPTDLRRPPRSSPPLLAREQRFAAGFPAGSPPSATAAGSTSCAG
jgi:hypothetical protein